ncbi:MAG: PDDEXK nuclease domain-containing protein [Lachnospiraceae bacterium]|nr:PDDEXK nuclease domain-containing protein [Lachnospiraceae bacterium]
MKDSLTFDNLIGGVTHVHDVTSAYAKGAVNQLLTVRNWMIGYYIVEYEQHGQNRAEYGSNLLGKMAEKLCIKGLDRTNLNLCRLFYLRYPQICETVSHKLKGIGEIQYLPKLSNQMNEKGKNNNEICETVSHKFETKPELLVSRLSFSHIREIMSIEDPFERFFYEFECIKGTWSVRELKRQISTNLYVRAGISRKPEQLLDQLVNNDFNAVFNVKDPIALEFLGLDAKESITESDLEKALKDHLQEFMLELGSGFCFEARHKRILIDDDYYFPDLVFYNRILHCSVIVELKNEEFSHENFGQLNAYVGYYKENEMYPGDNPPVGILLCTKKGKKMVEYALSGMDNQLFASTYMLQLPNKKQLEDFLIKQMDEFGL